MHPAPERSLSVIIPAYNEVESLEAFMQELVAALQDLLAMPEPPCHVTSASVYIVDDGSTDGTLALAHSLSEQYSPIVPVHVVTLRRNFGKSAAMSAGFSVATGDLIVTFDADGQDVPGELPKVLGAMQDEDLDLVCGWRQSRIDRPVKKNTSRIYNMVTSRGTGLDLHDFNTGLKLMTREVVTEVPLYGEFHRFIPVLAHDLGFKVGEVAVEHRPRVAGVSKYLSLTRFPKTLLDLFSVIFLTRFANSPMYFYGGLGMVLGGLGFAVGVYLSVLKLFFGEGIGQRPLLILAVLLMVVGIQLVATGLLGESLRHAQAGQRAPFRIREVSS